MLSVIATLLVFAALASYINYRFLRMPATIGLMIVALVSSVMIVIAGEMGVPGVRQAAAWVTRLDFDDLLLHGMLSFLLFAGALHVKLDDLKLMRVPVAVLATLGVVVATLVTGLLLRWVASWVGYDLPLLQALLFGALIAPTDPIAALGILKTVGAPKALETKIAGESLFNDGIGVVVFLTILGVASGSATPTVGSVLGFLAMEALGGAALGLLLGYVTYRLLASVDQYQVEVLLTLALAAGGYALAEAIHVSAPIAAVVAGLLIGNHGRAFAMSETTREHLDTFWELIDEVLNAVLFVLIGLEIIVLVLHGSYLLVGLLAIPVVLIGRWVSVIGPVLVLAKRFGFQRGTTAILTWGGLRGGISIALALSLPVSDSRDLLITVTYVVVVFSVLVQGLSFSRLLRHYAAK